MEVKEDIVIIGAGIAGLATSLGLHRYVIIPFRLYQVYIFTHINVCVYACIKPIRNAV